MLKGHLPRVICIAEYILIYEEHIRQSGPDFVSGCWVQVRETVPVVPSFAAAISMMCFASVNSRIQVPLPVNLRG